jgi:hypothetical protein
VRNVPMGTAIVSGCAQLSDTDAQFMIDTPALPWIPKELAHISERRRRS